MIMEFVIDVAQEVLPVSSVREKNGEAFFALKITTKKKSCLPNK